MTQDENLEAADAVERMYASIAADRRTRAKPSCPTCKGEGWRKVWDGHDPAITDCTCLSSISKGASHDH